MKLPLHAYWRLLRRYLAPQRWAVLWMAVLLLAHTTSQVTGPQMLRRFVDLALAGDTASGEVTAPLGDAMSGSEPRVLTRTGLLLLSIQVFEAATGILAGYWGRRVAWKATNGLN